MYLDNFRYNQNSIKDKEDELNVYVVLCHNSKNDSELVQMRKNLVNLMKNIMFFTDQKLQLKIITNKMNEFHDLNIDRIR